ncbi:MAG: hypothetical protein ACRD3S_11740, partial [Terracidiphilus sp.]
TALALFTTGALSDWYPPPGVAAAFLSVVAAAMSLQTGMRGSHKALWMLLIGAFFAIELLAIGHERSEQNKQQEATLREERKHFGEIADGIQRTMEQTEGGDGYCWLVPVPPLPSQTTSDKSSIMIAPCQDDKNLPIIDVVAMIQEALSNNPTSEEIIKKTWHEPAFHLGTLGSGGWNPTDIKLGPGKYNISIFSRRNAVLEQMYFGYESTARTWDTTYCVYEYRTGKLLTGSKNCRSHR